MQKLLFSLRHRNDFLFNPSPRDFVVEEIPLYPFSGSGEHLILKIRKKNLTTWQLIEKLSAHLGIKKKHIGYAGLKDKHAMTIQHLSIPAMYEKKLESFTVDGVKILEMVRHSNKLRIGHLKGNRFTLRLKKVLGVQLEMIESVLDWIEENGMPNYFGAQRFGQKGDNWSEGKRLLEGSLKMRDKKMRDFLIGSYQSYLFNAHLSKRIELSSLLESFSEAEVEKLIGLESGALNGAKAQPHFFKLLQGDVMMHYPHGKLFFTEEIVRESERFVAQDIAPTGLLPGKKATPAKEVARQIEERFDEPIDTLGARRYMWVWPKEIESIYHEKEAQLTLRFTLPKGSYATVLVEFLRGVKQEEFN